MNRYTKDGQTFYKAGDKVGDKYCVSEAWLLRNGYGVYTVVADDGVDGLYDGKWIHYTGKPAPPPEPQPEPEPTPEELKEKARQQKLQAIEAYDTSSAVNGFQYNGVTMWIDKATRVGLVNAVDSAILLDKEDITFGISGVSVTMSCTAAQGMLAQLEMYALDCYNVTLGHKTAVNALETREEIEAYDYTVGYPEQLVFNDNEA